jgi:hypothetical protein
MWLGSFGRRLGLGLGDLEKATGCSLEGLGGLFVCLFRGLRFGWWVPVLFVLSRCLEQWLLFWCVLDWFSVFSEALVRY